MFEDLDLHSMIEQKDEYLFNCPECHKRGLTMDTGHNLQVNFNKGVYHCWRCSIKGSASVFATKVFGLTKSVGMYLQNLISNKKKDERDVLKREIYEPSSIGNPIHELDTPMINYLKSRNISYEDAKRERLMSGKGYLKDRLIIPTYDDYDNLVYFVARTITNAYPKYLNPRDSNKVNSVYRLNEVNEGDIVIVAEGSLSAFAAQRKIEKSFFVDRDYMKAVAIYGKSIDTNQAKLIANKKPCAVLVILDEDTNEFDKKRNYQIISNVYKGKLLVTKMDKGYDDLDNAPQGIVESLIQRSLYEMNNIRYLNLKI